MPDESYNEVVHPDRVPCGQHERRYNAPISNNDIAVVIANRKQTTAETLFYEHATVPSPESLTRTGSKML